MWGWIYRQDNFWEFLSMFQHPAFIGRGQLSDNLDKLVVWVCYCRAPDKYQCAPVYGEKMFSVLCRLCLEFHFKLLETIFIKFWQLSLCKQKGSLMDLMRPAYKYLVLVMHCICVYLFFFFGTYFSFIIINQVLMNETCQSPIFSFLLTPPPY